MGEGDVEVAAAVFELAAQHLLGDGKKVDDGVVVDAPRSGHARPGRAKSGARLFGLGDLPQHRMGHALGIEHHRRGRAVELAVLGSSWATISRHLPKRISTCCFIDRYPSMKSAIGGDGMRSSSSGVVSISSCAACEGRRVLAEEHRAVDHEMMVVVAVDRVDVHRSLALRGTCGRPPTAFWL